MNKVAPIDVGLEGEDVILDGFGCQPFDGQLDGLPHLVFRVNALAQALAQPEVGYLDQLVLAIVEAVPRGDVPVDDPQTVDIGQSVGRPGAHANLLAGVDHTLARLQVGIQTAAVHQLQDDPDRLFQGQHAVEADHVAVLEAVLDPGFLHHLPHFFLGRLALALSQLDRDTHRLLLLPLQEAFANLKQEKIIFLAIL